MRFATYEYGGAVYCGAVDEFDRIHPMPAGTRLIDLIGAGADALHAAGDAALAAEPGPPTNQVRLLPPIQPPTIRDFVTFEEHVEGVRRSVDRTRGVPEAWYDAPTFYFANPYAVIGAHDHVPVPRAGRARPAGLAVTRAQPVRT